MDIHLIKQSGSHAQEELGGFQSGFHAQKVTREKAKWPKYLVCSHNCEEIIQLVSHVSGLVEFEMCRIEAERMAKVLLEACTVRSDS
jgi:hypothetical protein